jgi:hypothetical protein
MEIFCKKMLANYSEFFKEKYKQEVYPNQDVKSCLSLITKCIEFNPDYVIDIGTNYGASTLSFAYALKKLGKDLSCLTTVDMEASYWKNTISRVQCDLMGEYDINPYRIKVVTSDFKVLDPKKIIPENSKIFLFYDIHDILSFSFFEKFIKDWAPLLKGAYIGIHDISLVPKDFQFIGEDDPDYPHINADHFSGKTVNGFIECKVIMDWLNSIGKDFYPVENTSVIYIEM